jgi:hypothetical protein
MRFYEVSWATEAQPAENGFEGIFSRPSGSSERLEITLKLPTVCICAGAHSAVAGWREQPLPARQPASLPAAGALIAADGLASVCPLCALCRAQAACS